MTVTRRDEIEFDSLCAAGRTYHDRRLGAGSLCDRCEHGRIYRRRDAPDVAVYCRSLPTRVPPDIAECSAYRAATALTLGDMMDMALTIDPREEDGRGAGWEARRLRLLTAALGATPLWRLAWLEDRIVLACEVNALPTSHR